VECRSTGQFGPLQDDNVAFTELGEVVTDAGAGHATTDHDDPGGGGHVTDGRHA
jgi:hypothetical protein